MTEQAANNQKGKSGILASVRASVGALSLAGEPGQREKAWKLWQDRFERATRWMAVTNDDKLDLLLLVGGEELQKLIQTLPEQPTHYKSHIEKLDQHFKANRNNTLELYKLYKFVSFVSVMKDYSPLADSARVSADDDDPIVVTEQSVARKLREVSTSRASGPDDIPNWVLKEYADILAVPIADILNASFSEVSVPRVWKLADVPPLPKAPIVSDFNKDLRPISLTSTMSKIAESFVIEKALKPVVLSHIDPGQFGFIPGSSTTFALISMFHHWLRATDGLGRL